VQAGIGIGFYALIVIQQEGNVKMLYYAVVYQVKTTAC
jgi:hypothetical protein